MKEDYTKWIEDYVERTPALLGKCHKAAAEMKEAFPELIVTKGHVYTHWGKRSHAWLVAENGIIVDPTAGQFVLIAEYEPWVPGTEVRVGKCMECGEEIWKALQSLDEPGHGASFCNERCELGFAHSLG